MFDYSSKHRNTARTPLQRVYLWRCLAWRFFFGRFGFLGLGLGEDQVQMADRDVGDAPERHGHPPENQTQQKPINPKKQMQQAHKQT